MFDLYQGKGGMKSILGLGKQRKAFLGNHGITGDYDVVCTNDMHKVFTYDDTRTPLGWPSPFSIQYRTTLTCSIYQLSHKNSGVRMEWIMDRRQSNKASSQAELYEAR